MTLLRGLAKRIVVVTIACGFVGLLSARVSESAARRDNLLHNTIPVWMHLWKSTEQARCEAAPETWTLSIVPGTTVWAYDAQTLRSRNPDAPPLDSALVAGFPPGGDRAVVKNGPFWGGMAIFRPPGVVSPWCGLIVVSWTARVHALDATLGLLCGGLFVASLAAVLGIGAVVRPLATRIGRLKRAAESVGDAGRYASSEPGSDDDLGDLSASLDRAHARICDDAHRLEQRQADLRRYLDDVTHDLRTPISSLQLTLEQASDAARDFAQRELLHGALKDVVYLGALAANLRLASQLREGWSPTAATTPVNLRDAVERVAARARILARRGGIDLDVAVPDKPILAKCDPVAAEQAIGNVVDNAVAYGNRGGHIAIVLEREDARFVVRVEDDGPGVRASDLPRLGERTFRSDEARQRDPRGSGLGLAITAEVCERCGWALTFDPASPSGLRVTLRGALIATAFGCPDGGD
jgi:signal transduction histidine kinase